MHRHLLILLVSVFSVTPASADLIRERRLEEQTVTREMTDRLLREVPNVYSMVETRLESKQGATTRERELVEQMKRTTDPEARERLTRKYGDEIVDVFKGLAEPKTGDPGSSELAVAMRDRKLGGDSQQAVGDFLRTYTSNTKTSGERKNAYEELGKLDAVLGRSADGSSPESMRSEAAEALHEGITTSSAVTALGDLARAVSNASKPGGATVIPPGESAPVKIELGPEQVKQFQKIAEADMNSFVPRSALEASARSLQELARTGNKVQRDTVATGEAEIAEKGVTEPYKLELRAAVKKATGKEPGANETVLEMEGALKRALSPKAFAEFLEASKLKIGKAIHDFLAKRIPDVKTRWQTLLSLLKNQCLPCAVVSAVAASATLYVGKELMFPSEVTNEAKVQLAAYEKTGEPRKEKGPATPGHINPDA